MFSPLFLHPWPLTCSAPISSRLLEKSENSCQNIQMFFPLTVFRPLHISMKFSMTFLQYLVLQLLPKLAVEILGSWLPPRRSFSRWRKLVLFDVLPLQGLPSPWSSPLHMVPKSDSTWRPCGDFCPLNTATVPDRYPLPPFADFSTRLTGSKFFT